MFRGTLGVRDFCSVVLTREFFLAASAFGLRPTPKIPAARVSPFLAWGDFHAHSRFARSTIPEEKWGLSYYRKLTLHEIKVLEINAT